MLHRKPVQLDQGRGGKKLRTLAIEYNRIVCRKLNKEMNTLKQTTKSTPIGTLFATVWDQNYNKTLLKLNPKR